MTHAPEKHAQAPEPAIPPTPTLPPPPAPGQEPPGPGGEDISLPPIEEPVPAI